MKVLVTGSHRYPGPSEPIDIVLAGVHARKPITLLIEGGAAGVDTMARNWAIRNNVLFHTYHAQWSLYGRAAGAMRNQKMLDLEHLPEAPISLGLGFPDGESRGTFDMLTSLREAGIPVEVYALL